MNASSLTYDWVREIKPELKKLDSIPLSGNTPPFPWDEFSAKLAQSLECETLKITPGEKSWRSSDLLLEGYGDNPFLLTFTIPSLKGKLYWIVSREEMAILAAAVLTKETTELNIHDTTLIESFTRFFAVEILYNLSQITFDKALIPTLVSHSEIPEKDSLCWDISLNTSHNTIWSRLVITPELRISWVDYFAKLQHPPSALMQQLAQLVDIVVHLEVGKSLLTLQEWSEVCLGDFLTLDSCSLNTDDLNGRIMLTINGKQAFRAKLKDGNLKILEFPLFHEVEAPMAKQPESENENEEDEDELSDLDLSEDEDEDDDDDYDDFEDETFDESEEELTEEMEEEDSIDEESKDEDSGTEHLGEPSEHNEIVEPRVTQGPFTPDQIPISLIVELGQFKMTMDQLLKLEPGNLLELAIHPENGVDLTINGKVVGKGELIRIGEALGVRVLQLG